MTDIAKMGAALDRGLAEIRELTRVPGISIVASVHGESISAHAGVASLETSKPLTEASTFEVSCLMKLLVSTLVWRETLRGTLSLSDRVDKYLPEFVGSSVSTSAVSIGHLMSHTSGLRGLDVSDSRTKWGYSWPQLTAHYKRQATSFPAGSVFNYDHSEHVMLGEVLSRRLNRDISEIVKDEIFGPLAIDTGCSAEDRQVPSIFVDQHIFSSGAGKFTAASIPAFSSFWRASLPNMTIRLRDVVRIGEWMMSEASGIGSSGLHNSTISLVSQVAANSNSEQLPRSFGHVCAQYPAGIVGHNGSTYGQTVALRMNPETGTVMAAGVNAWVPKARDEVLRLTRELLRGTCPTPISPDVDPVPFQFEQLAGSFSPPDLEGTYVGSLGGQVAVAQSNGGITITVGSSTSRATNILVESRTDGMYQIISKVPFSCGFSPHPEDASPVCYLGVHAYRKADAN